MMHLNAECIFILYIYTLKQFVYVMMMFHTSIFVV